MFGPLQTLKLLSLIETLKHRPPYYHHCHYCENCGYVFCCVLWFVRFFFSLVCFRFLCVCSFFFFVRFVGIVIFVFCFVRFLLKFSLFFPKFLVVCCAKEERGQQHQRKGGGGETTTRKGREGKQHQPKEGWTQPSLGGAAIACSFRALLPFPSSLVCVASHPSSLLDVATFPLRSCGWRCCSLLSF